MSEAHDITILMKTLADPTRRALFERIAEIELSVTDLIQGSGVSQGAISQHLKLLKQAGLVRERPDGRKVYYRAAPEGLAPLVTWMSDYGVFWRDRFAKLSDLLKEMDP